MVGFRAYVQHHATQLGVRGIVRNRGDGTLECVVEGDQGSVERLIDLLRSGPRAARVDGVEVEYGAPTGELPRMMVSA
jgi:acylphosphatase